MRLLKKELSLPEASPNGASAQGNYPSSGEISSRERRFSSHSGQGSLNGQTTPSGSGPESPAKSQIKDRLNTQSGLSDPSLIQKPQPNATGESTHTPEGLGQQKQQQCPGQSTPGGAGAGAG
ncbi:unnamed protein product, partial [Heterosigma akashiwo]